MCSGIESYKKKERFEGAITALAECRAVSLELESKYNDTIRNMQAISNKISEKRTESYTKSINEIDHFLKYLDKLDERIQSLPTDK